MPHSSITGSSMPRSSMTRSSITRSRVSPNMSNPKLTIFKINRYIQILEDRNKNIMKRKLKFEIHLKNPRITRDMQTQINHTILKLQREYIQNKKIQMLTRKGKDSIRIKKLPNFYIYN